MRVFESRHQKIAIAVDFAVERADICTFFAKRDDLSAVNDELAGKQRRCPVERQDAYVKKSNFHKRIVPYGRSGFH
ncbi:hypothetical protein SDC9_82585 [bioreactor metagenome]|uniref:Uncharacterized protein n=1 Tax=bioreactor metagenome TaxID=1076179 RepID=A0A644Z519_9ZZZZ